VHFDTPDDPFRGIRKNLLLYYGFSAQRAEQMLDDPMLSNNRWTPLRYQVAQMIDQARDGDSQAQEELRYFKQLFPGVRDTGQRVTVMKPAASPPPGHVLDTKRVGTDARHRTLEWLQWAYAEGILGDDDFDARQAAAMKAQTQPDLDALVTDLPDKPPAVASAPVAAMPPAVRSNPAGLFAWTNMVILSALAAFTLLIMVGLPVLPAGVAAAGAGNLLTAVRAVVDRRRAAV